MTSDRRLRPIGHQLRRILTRDQAGVALPLALVIILILTALVMAMAQMSTSEAEIHRATYLDARALYLAAAGLEHQIYVLKGNKNGGALAPTNYPVTAGEEYWYSTTLTCVLQCTDNRESRRWEIRSTGEIRKSGTAQVLQTRAIRVLAEIAFSGSGANLYQFPSKVKILRWEEVYP